MTRASVLTSSTFAFTLAAATLGLVSRAEAASPSTAECLAAADSSIQLRDQHQLRAARTQMLVCASPSCPSAIQTECLRRVDQINAALPTVVFEAKDPAGNDLSNIKVDMDGQPLVDRLDGSAVPLDPGEHHFHFTAPGGIVADKTIVIHESEKDRHERIVIGTPLPPGTAQPAPAGAVSPTPAEPAEDPGASRRTTAYVVGGVGVVGLAVGAIFGGLALSSASSSKSECSTSDCGTSKFNQSQSDYNTASTDGTVSTVAFIAGGAALVAGGILFLTAPKASSSATGSVWQFSPAVGSTGLGLTVKGAL
jgi:hypothetical protein